MFRTMAYARSGAHVILVHGTRTPSDAEWDAYLGEAAPWLMSCAGLLVMSAGGGPNSAQRRALRAAIAGDTVSNTRTAVVSRSMVVRSILAAISLFVPAIRGFAPHDIDHALDHIRVAPEQRPALLAEAERLRLSLS